MPLPPLVLGFLLIVRTMTAFAYGDATETVRLTVPLQQAGLETEEQELLPGDF